MLRVYELEVTTDADGDGTATKGIPWGKFIGFAVNYDATSPAGTDLTLDCVMPAPSGTRNLVTLTDVNTDVGIKQVKSLVQDEGGTDISGTLTDGEFDYNLVGGHLLLTIDQGGDSKVVSITVIIDSEDGF